MSEENTLAEEAPPIPGFIHLRVHSEFSLVDGLVRISALADTARENAMPAVGLTDAGNFFGLIKFFKATKNVGVKPIFGADIWVLPEERDSRPHLVTLLVKDAVGYKNLTQLISRSYLEGQHQGRPFVRREWICEHSSGLIALSGAREGDVGKALLTNQVELAEKLLQQWMTDFPQRFYVELCRTGRADEEEYIQQVVPLAEKLGCPPVATNDVHFLNQEEYEAHEARVCINEGRVLDDPRRERRYSEHQYFRTISEMQALFADIPEALENTVHIAQRCNYFLKLGETFLPAYPVPEGMEEAEYFQEVSRQGLEERFANDILPERIDSEEKKQIYRDRLDFELGIINQMEFPGYFLIVMDFIRWAKQNQIPVGPGRGSGAGSLVAYALQITDLDPLQYDLLFERFLNPERVSMPDFDIDFCMDNRDRVIAYVAEKYGRDAVSQIITFGTMAAKAVVRDVARVQGKSYGLADKLSKMIPLEIGMTLSKAREQEKPLQEFLDNDEEAQEIWEMALQLEGLARNAGKHAGGVVIAPTALTDFAPLYCDEVGEGLVTQYDKDDVEQVGLIKFDFLGLRTLTIIDWAVRRVNEKLARAGKPALDLNALELEDPETYALLQRAETTAVFQLESRGIKDLIKRQLPNCFDDIVALVALYRPGPLQSGMVDDFIDRKHGRAPVAYPHEKYQHECLKPILQPTYGIILYQEQVMQIAQVMGGYTLGGADLLRRAMGKKKAEEMARQRDMFLEGAKQQGFSEDLAANIFDLMEKFAGYGFNKSHSAAYALIAYQTAWLKAHYPAEFMAAVLSADMQNTDKVVTLIEECREMGLPLLPPDINQGEFAFSVSEKGEIIYGLGAIKGLGEGPVQNIIDARQEEKLISDIFDFCARVDLRKVNKRALEALIRSGSLDSIAPEGEIDFKRAVLSAAMEDAVRAADQHNENARSGMVDLFGSSLQERAPEMGYHRFQNCRPLSEKERLLGERETLGLYLTGHPYDEYEAEIAHMVGNRINNLKPSRDSQRVAGLVVGMRVMKTKRGENMAILQLDDRSGRMDVALIGDAFETQRNDLVKDSIIVIEGEVSEDDYTGGVKMRGKKVGSLFETRQRFLKELMIDVDGENLSAESIRELEEIIEPYRQGVCNISIGYNHPRASAKIQLGDAWRVEPRDELIHRLRENFGKQQVQLKF